MLNRSPLLGCVFTLLFYSGAVADSFFDGEFGDHWRAVGTGGGNRPFVLVEDQATGGNPGASRYTEQVMSDQNILTKESRISHFYELQTYDPAQGPINQVSFALDALATLIDSSNNLVQFGPALWQDNRPFHYNPVATGQIGIDELGLWKSFQFDELTASDFIASERFPDGFPVPQVDFSTDGEPISFGYYAYVFKSHPNLFVARANTRIDNWRVDVTSLPVPEPTCLVLALLALFSSNVLAARRHPAAV